MRLSAKADLAPRGDAFLEGAVQLANADAGGIDRERLPITEARARLSIGPGGIVARDIALGFPAGARATGEAAWKAGRLDAKLAVKGLDLVAWHSALRPTALAGEISARVDGGAQAFTVDLSDPRFRIAGDARIEKGVFTVERARLERGRPSRSSRARSPSRRRGPSRCRDSWSGSIRPRSRRCRREK